jgi:hypothetical protein
LFHLGIGIWIYGNPNLIVDRNQSAMNQVNQFTQNILQSVGEIGNIIYTRVNYTHNLIMFGFFVVFVLFLIIKYLLIDFVSIFCGNCCRNKVEVERDNSIEIGNGKNYIKSAMNLKGLNKIHEIRKLQHHKFNKINSKAENLNSMISDCLQYDIKKIKEKIMTILVIPPEMSDREFERQMNTLIKKVELEDKSLITGDIRDTSYNIAVKPIFKSSIILSIRHMHIAIT